MSALPAPPSSKDRALHDFRRCALAAVVGASAAFPPAVAQEAPPPAVAQAAPVAELAADLVVMAMAFCRQRHGTSDAQDACVADAVRRVAALAMALNGGPR